MSERIKITPRAQRLAKSRGINFAQISAKGTGFQGGVTEADLIAWIDAGGAGVAPAAAPAVAFVDESGIRATSLARKVAAANGVGLAGIPGRGSFGKILKADVESAIASGIATAGGAVAVAEAGRDAIGTTPDGKRIAQMTPYAGVRKIIGDRLAMSKSTAPHLYFMQKVDMTECLALRVLVNSKQDKKTSVTDYINRAVIMTLQTFPAMNSALIGGEIEEYVSVNLGIAVNAPGGLIVPVIKEAQDMSIVQFSKAASALIEKAREGKLTPGDYTGGTFTVSNLGMTGLENFTAILNPPEVGILAVSATKDEPLVVVGSDGKKTIEIRPMMNITISVDHRIIDGFLAAQFVTEVKRLLESPIELMVRNWE